MVLYGFVDLLLVVGSLDLSKPTGTQSLAAGLEATVQE